MMPYPWMIKYWPDFFCRTSSKTWIESCRRSDICSVVSLQSPREGLVHSLQGQCHPWGGNSICLCPLSNWKKNFPRVFPAYLASWLISQVYVTCPNHGINHLTKKNTVFMTGLDQWFSILAAQQNYKVSLINHGSA